MWHGESWPSAFWTSLDDLAALATSAPVRVVYVLIGLTIAGMLLLVATEWLKKKNYGPDSLVLYLSRFFPIKPFVHAIGTVTELNASMKRASSGETRWFVALVTFSDPDDKNASSHRPAWRVRDAAFLARVLVHHVGILRPVITRQILAKNGRSVHRTADARFVSVALSHLAYPAHGAPTS